MCRQFLASFLALRHFYQGVTQHDIVVDTLETDKQHRECLTERQ